MVKLEEVDDESLTNPQVGPIGDENDWEDDTDDNGMHPPTRSRSPSPIPLIPRRAPTPNPPGDTDPNAESDLDSTDDDDAYAPDSETLVDRLIALKDVVPPSARKSLTRFFRTSYAYFSIGLLWGGKALWVIGSSALLLGVPWALAYAEEQQMIEMEREMNMQRTSAEVRRVLRWSEKGEITVGRVVG